MKVLIKNGYHKSMKILHTSDLHIGRFLHEFPLIEDQEYILNVLTDILIHDSYDVLLIAGDIYDRSIPSPEAVSLFSRFLGRLNREARNLSVLIISGNHDSQTRLGYGSEIFAEQRIHLCTDPLRAWEPLCLSAGGVTVDFYLVPFLPPGSYTDGEGEFLSGQGEMLAYALAKAKATLRNDHIPVLCCHSFARGGIPSESERIFVGSAEQVDPSLFGPFAYTALGHLHSLKQIAERTWYSGSPLSYSFSEAESEKCFLSVHIGKDSVDVERIPIEPRRRVSRIEASFEELKGGRMFDDFADDYLEIVLKNPEVVQNAALLLRAKFPYLLSVRQQAFENFSEPASEAVERTEGSILDDFLSFKIFLDGKAPDAETRDLFTKALAEVSADETDQARS